jgi:hypothetical protein
VPFTTTLAAADLGLVSLTLASMAFAVMAKHSSRFVCTVG